MELEVLENGCGSFSPASILNMTNPVANDRPMKNSLIVVAASRSGVKENEARDILKQHRIEHASRGRFVNADSHVPQCPCGDARNFYAQRRWWMLQERDGWRFGKAREQSIAEPRLEQSTHTVGYRRQVQSGAGFCLRR